MSLEEQDYMQEEKKDVRQEKPDTVHHALIGIWLTIGLSAFSYLIDKNSGNISFGEFYFNLAILGIMVMLPYKISKGSNPARYIYTVLMIMSVFIILGGETPEMARMKFTMIMSYICMPIEAIIIYWLFTEEANRWFNTIK